MPAHPPAPARERARAGNVYPYPWWDGDASYTIDYMSPARFRLQPAKHVYGEIMGDRLYYIVCGPESGKADEMIFYNRQVGDWLDTWTADFTDVQATWRLVPAPCEAYNCTQPDYAAACAKPPRARAASPDCDTCARARAQTAPACSFATHARARCQPAWRADSRLLLCACARACGTLVLISVGRRYEEWKSQFNSLWLFILVLVAFACCFFGAGKNREAVRNVTMRRGLSRQNFGGDHGAAAPAAVVQMQPVPVAAGQPVVAQAVPVGVVPVGAVQAVPVQGVPVQAGPGGEVVPVIPVAEASRV